MRKRGMALLCVSLFLVSLGTSGISVKADLNDDLENAKNEAVGIEKELQDIQIEIDKQAAIYNKAKSDAEEQEKRIDSLNADISSIEGNINKSEITIKEKQQLIEEKKQLAKDTKDIMDQRVRSYYKTGGTSEYLYMIINSQSIMEVFQNITAVTRLLNLDKDLINESNKIQEEQSKQVKLVEAELEKLEADKNELVTKRSEMEKVKDELVNIRKQEEEVLNGILSKQQEKKEKSVDIENKIDTLEEALKNSQNANQNNSNGNNSAQATFLRPVDGPITSPFGYRYHPSTGVWHGHKGVDFGNWYGTPIKAAKAGVVTYSGWMTGYGYVIIIDHRNGEQTVYAHQQELKVSVNQEVSQGDIIGLVGSSGDSTGPHLHFEIRINGQCVDPMDYIM